MIDLQKYYLGDFTLEDTSQGSRYLTLSRTTTKQEEVQLQLQSLNKWKNLNHPNLLQLKQIEKEIKSNWCSTFFYVKAKYEYLNNNLHQELLQRKMKKKYFTAIELLRLIYDSISIGAFLQEKEIKHSEINPNLIFLYNDQSNEMNRMKLCERFNGSNNSQLNILNAVNENIDIYVTPEEFENLSKPNIAFEINNFKKDVFSFGLCFLEAGILESIQSVYNNLTSSFVKEILFMYKKKFNHFYNKHSLLKSILEKMLEFNEQDRPDFIELRDALPPWKEVSQIPYNHSYPLVDNSENLNPIFETNKLYKQQSNQNKSISNVQNISKKHEVYNVNSDNDNQRMSQQSNQQNSHFLRYYAESFQQIPRIPFPKQNPPNTNKTNFNLNDFKAKIQTEKQQFDQNNNQKVLFDQSQVNTNVNMQQFAQQEQIQQQQRQPDNDVLIDSNYNMQQQDLDNLILSQQTVVIKADNNQRQQQPKTKRKLFQEQNVFSYEKKSLSSLRDKRKQVTKLNSYFNRPKSPQQQKKNIQIQQSKQNQQEDQKKQIKVIWDVNGEDTDVLFKKNNIPEIYKSENGQIYKRITEEKTEQNDQGQLINKIFVKYIPFEENKNQQNVKIQNLNPKFQQLTKMLQENEEEPYFTQPSNEINQNDTHFSQDTDFFDITNDDIQKNSNNFHFELKELPIDTINNNQYIQQTNQFQKNNVIMDMIEPKETEMIKNEQIDKVDSNPYMTTQKHKLGDLLRKYKENEEYYNSKVFDK